MKDGGAIVVVSQRAQEGAALLVIMILVLVVGLMAAVGLRASIFSMNVAGTTRSQSLALEAAEMALRYCEQQALSPTPAITIYEVFEEGEPIARRWQVKEVWEGGSKSASSVPLSLLNSDSSKQTYSVAPQCLVERLRLPTDPDKDELGFLVTARGFSPDATLTSSGALASGAQVWIQSIVQQ